MSSEKPSRRPVGRPRLYPNGKAIGVHVTLDPAIVNWASQQPGGISGTVRRCLEQMQQKGGE